MQSGKPEFQYKAGISLLDAEDTMHKHSLERIWHQPYRQITSSKRSTTAEPKILLRDSWREAVDKGFISEQLALKVLWKQLQNYFNRLVKLKKLRDKR